MIHLSKVARVILQVVLSDSPDLRCSRKLCHCNLGVRRTIPDKECDIRYHLQNRSANDIITQSEPNLLHSQTLVRELVDFVILASGFYLTMQSLSYQSNWSSNYGCYCHYCRYCTTTTMNDILYYYVDVYLLLDYCD